MRSVIGPHHPSRIDRKPNNQTNSADAEEVFKLLINAVDDYAIFVLNPHGYIETWSSGAEKLKGYSSDEIIGCHFSRFYTRSDLNRNHPQHELEVAARTGKYAEEGWRVRKDGSVFWANVTITALRDNSGKLRGFGKVTRDLTQRKRSELELKQSEERFRLMVECVQDYAIFMLDSKGNVTTWNKGAQRNKGYNADEVIGTHFSQFYPAEEQAVGKPERVLGEAVKNGRFEDEGWQIRKDGSRFWANVVITPLHDDEQRLIGFSNVTRNLTERKSAEDALRESHANLEERILLRTKELEKEKWRAEKAVTARDHFFSIASHELKTPLFSLKLQSQLRQRRLNKNRLSDFTPEKLKKLFREDDMQVNRLSTLVDNMLDLSRLTSGNLQLAKESIHLKSLLEEILDRTQPLMAESHNEVFLNGPEDICGVWDRARLEQVFTNLLTNAGKYAAGKPVIFTIEKIDDCVSISVQDFGAGISEEHQKRIFEPFQRINPHGSTPGLGLGLHICKCIIEAHGGTLRVQSRMGQGSLFKVELPLKHDPNFDS